MHGSLGRALARDEFSTLALDVKITEKPLKRHYDVIVYRAVNYIMIWEVSQMMDNKEMNSRQSGNCFGVHSSLPSITCHHSSC